MKMARKKKISKKTVRKQKTTEIRRHQSIGARDKHILATGYNGAPAGLPDCLELGCLRNAKGIPSGKQAEICRAVHAEQNVIIQAALHGVSIKGSTIYCTHSPCVLCAKMLVNAQIKRFVSFGRYSDDEFLLLFKEAGIEFEMHPKPNLNITYLD
jgi:dCMP deaminase